MKRTYTETVLGEAGQHNCLPAFCPGQELGVGEKEGMVFEQRGGDLSPMPQQLSWRTS